jgi:RND family efflux transporter MFP subunit
MLSPINAELRPSYDDYLISSVNSHQAASISPIENRPPAAPTRRSWRARFAVLGAALLVAACQAETAPAPQSERLVQVQQVAFENSGETREFVGVVRARYETDLAFRIGGKMVARVVNVGDRVRVGDVIARLDPQDLKLQVESAEAELGAATSSLSQAAADLQRYDILKARGFAPIAEFDRRKTANDEAQGRLARAQRALELARNQFSYAELKAGADGVITATLAEPGQVVAIGQPVARLAHRGEKEAVIALPETWLGKARQANATVQLWADHQHRYQVRLRELSPQADPATRTYAARFTILDADDSVAFGMTATVTLALAREAPIARLPLASILNRGTGPSVYVIDKGGALALHPVTVAAFTEDDALVSSGDKDGDTVVTLGVQKLEAGLKVRPISVRN